MSSIRSHSRAVLGAARAGWLTWRHLTRPGDVGRRAALEAFALDEALRRPVLYRDRRGLVYELRPGENAHAYFAHEGNYEVAETRFCERALRPGATAVDVGANIGLYTLLFSRLAGPDGSVHAFEPEPANFERLERNVALNGCANVVLNRLAVFSSSRTAHLHVFAAGLNAWHSLARPELPDPFRPGQVARPEGTIAVDAVSLDDYAADRGLARVDLLKVDVEGLELDVLEGARGLLGGGAVDLVQFEVSLPQVRAAGHDPQAAFELLGGHRFRCFAIEPDGTLGGEVSRPTGEYANYVAVRDGVRPPA